MDSLVKEVSLLPNVESCTLHMYTSLLFGIQSMSWVYDFCSAAYLSANISMAICLAQSTYVCLCV